MSKARSYCRACGSYHIDKKPVPHCRTCHSTNICFPVGIDEAAGAKADLFLVLVADTGLPMHTVFAERTNLGLETLKDLRLSKDYARREGGAHKVDTLSTDMSVSPQRPQV